MISKAFQTMVKQLSEVVPKKFGITDSHGLVLASNGTEPSSDIVEDLIYTATNSEKTLFKNGYTVKAMSNKPYSEYVVYVEGTDELAKYCCNAVMIRQTSCRILYSIICCHLTFIRRLVSCILILMHRELYSI